MLNVQNSTEYEKVAQKVCQAVLATKEVHTSKTAYGRLLALIAMAARSGMSRRLDKVLRRNAKAFMQLPDHW